MSFCERSLSISKLSSLSRLFAPFIFILLFLAELRLSYSNLFFFYLSPFTKKKTLETKTYSWITTAERQILEILEQQRERLRGLPLITTVLVWAVLSLEPTVMLTLYSVWSCLMVLPFVPMSLPTSEEWSSMTDEDSIRINFSWFKGSLG